MIQHPTAGVKLTYTGDACHNGKPRQFTIDLNCADKLHTITCLCGIWPPLGQLLLRAFPHGVVAFGSSGKTIIIHDILPHFNARFSGRSIQQRQVESPT
jgi:hypothetical protein